MDILYVYKYEMSLTLMWLFLWVGVLDQRNKEIKQDRAFVRKKTVMRVCH